jgi:hypothetical protein
MSLFENAIVSWFYPTGELRKLQKLCFAKRRPFLIILGPAGGEAFKVAPDAKPPWASTSLRWFEKVALKRINPFGSVFQPPEPFDNVSRQLTAKPACGFFFESPRELQYFFCFRPWLPRPPRAEFAPLASNLLLAVCGVVAPPPLVREALRLPWPAFALLRNEICLRQKISIDS